jgi:hypothetical protein
MKQMQAVKDYCIDEPGVDGIIALVQVQTKSLQKEVDKYCRERDFKA